MSTTSQKAQSFVGEPMGEKPVTAIAGIGETLGKRLEESGFELACTLFGQFLLLKGDKELFCAWLKDTCGANAKQASDCHNCLAEWKDQFM